MEKPNVSLLDDEYASSDDNSGPENSGNSSNKESAVVATETGVTHVTDAVGEGNGDLDQQRDLSNPKEKTSVDQEVRAEGGGGSRDKHGNDVKEEGSQNVREFPPHICGLRATRRFMAFEGEGVKSLAVDRDCRYLVAGTQTGSLSLWDLRDRRGLTPLVTQKILESEKGISALAFSSKSVLSGTSMDLGKSNIPPFLLCQKARSLSVMAAEVGDMDTEGRGKNGGDGEFKKLIVTSKGDPYVRDMTRTQGHTHELLDAHWHPISPSIICTSSMDGTIRFFDVNDTRRVGLESTLPNFQLFKCTDERKLSISRILGVPSFCFLLNPDTKPHSDSVPSTSPLIVAAVLDGSLQLFDPRAPTTRPRIASLKAAAHTPSQKPKDLYREHTHHFTPNSGLNSGPNTGPKTSPNSKLEAEAPTRSPFVKVMALSEKTFAARSEDRLALFDIRNFRAPVHSETLSETHERSLFLGGFASRCPTSHPILLTYDGSFRAYTHDYSHGGGNFNMEEMLAKPSAVDVDTPLCCEPLWNRKGTLLGCRDGRIVLVESDSGVEEAPSDPFSTLLWSGVSDRAERMRSEWANASKLEGARIDVVAYNMEELPEDLRLTRDGEVRGRKRGRQIVGGANAPHVERNVRKERASRESWNESDQQRDSGALRNTEHAVTYGDEEDWISRMRKKPTGNPSRNVSTNSASASLVDRAYARTQPVTLLETRVPQFAQTLEGLRKCPKCGLKLCNCGFMQR